MKKFSFSLESLLSLRDLEEQNARTALAEVNAQIVRIDRRIEELEISVDSAYSSWNGESGRRFSPMDRVGLGVQVADIKRQVSEVRQTRQVTEERRVKAMQALKEATMRRKVVSNLKEKRLAEYQAELIKQEANEIEDIFNARRSAR